MPLTAWITPSSVWNRVTKTLLDHGHADRVSRAFHEVCTFPKRHPLSFLWVFRAVLAGKYPEAGGCPDTLEDIAICDRERMWHLRREMQIIFQDAFSSLNPRQSVGRIIQEPLIVHKIGTRQEQLERVQELL